MGIANPSSVNLKGAIRTLIVDMDEAGQNARD
jgi:hypothetical protein